MIRRITLLSSAIVFAAAAAGCTPSDRDKAKDESQAAAAKAESAAAGVAEQAKTAASQAANAVETAASDHGIGVKSTPDFVAAAAMGDMFEIRSSELALKTSKDPAVKKFARHMIADHTKLSHEMKAAAAKSPSPIASPADLNPDLQSKLDDLKSAAPADFDRKYLDDQRSGHDAALGMFKAYADKGDNVDVKSVAVAAVPTIQAHLDEVKALQKAEDNAKTPGK
jgi:putative membrane protein